MSCACSLVYPKVLMMVGRKSDKLYSGVKILEHECKH